MIPLISTLRLLMLRWIRSVIVMLMVIAMGNGFAQDVAALKGVIIKAPWVRLAPPNAPATGGYMTIINNSDKAINIVSGQSIVADKTELHTHIHDNGVMKMREVPSLVIPARGELALTPGGFHVMLIGMKSPLVEGQMVSINLTTDIGQTIAVQAPVRRVDASH